MKIDLRQLLHISWNSSWRNASMSWKFGWRNLALSRDLWTRRYLRWNQPRHRGCSRSPMIDRSRGSWNKSSSHNSDPRIKKLGKSDQSYAKNNSDQCKNVMWYIQNSCMNFPDEKRRHKIVCNLHRCVKRLLEDRSICLSCCLFTADNHLLCRLVHVCTSEKAMEDAEPYTVCIIHETHYTKNHYWRTWHTLSPAERPRTHRTGCGCDRTPGDRSWRATGHPPPHPSTHHNARRRNRTSLGKREGVQCSQYNMRRI